MTGTALQVLVTGGVRSGKSAHAEALLGEEPVTYVAAGPTAEDDPDPDWAERLARHRARRPATWTTHESRDLPGSLALEGPVLLDCLGTWLTALLDEAGLWEAPGEAAYALVQRELETAVAVLRDRHAPTVLVTNEVGLGVVPEHRSGRLFRDLLGKVNQTLGAACDEVHLVVAGRVLVLP